MMSNKKIDFIVSVSKLNMVLSKDLDGELGGIGFTDFIVLYYLHEAPNNKLRRIDLANKVGLTASGITRLLLPMEKIGLIKKEINAQDARVSFVLLASGGKKIFKDSSLMMKEFTDRVIPDDIEIEKITQTMGDIGGKIMWK